MKNEVVGFFTKHFDEESQYVRPKLDGVVFPSVSVQQNEMLISPFSLEE